ncbi:hypothetical protein SmJEL517_g03854 [Synchytrium microbalum]|uniref:Large conductance mechanosensitive channel protein n=1 Tax=Synchytrium microbalum TaxID=1806994 RepID=A0A507BUS9_9FUNG|nr:uncharacterized protein SmJEL517_g03854 [Synchytrium microbalum]TPX33200.1 hypothetical protein SmJEL517_g03854 [Synchytrium microbalum]
MRAENPSRMTPEDARRRMIPNLFGRAPQPAVEVAVAEEHQPLLGDLSDNLEDVRAAFDRGGKATLDALSTGWRTFYEFVYRGPVVDLGVGIVIGSTFSSIITSFIDDILTPPVSLLVGGSSLRQWFIVLRPGKSGNWSYLTLEDAKADAAITENVGRFLNYILNFLIVAMVMLFIVRGLSGLKRKLDPTAETSMSCPACTNSVSSLALKCPHCCTWLLMQSGIFVIDHGKH